jgi:hypothetical protein
MLGDSYRNDSMRVGNAYAVSLPGYQSILLGRNMGCGGNNCPRSTRESVAQRIRRDLKLERSAVANFASWPTLERAVESQVGDTTVNVSGTPFVDPEFPTDPVFAKLADREPLEVAPWGYRYDRQTWAIARRYLELHKPRYLYIGLGDTDETAHRDEYDSYFASLLEFDERLAELLTWLDASGEFGRNTSVLVTTDHGRGEGSNWTDHYINVRNAEKVWLLARTPATRGHGPTRSGGEYSQLNIRPTVERLMGLEPCSDCRAPIAELIH